MFGEGNLAQVCLATRFPMGLVRLMSLIRLWTDRRLESGRDTIGGEVQ